MLTIGFTNHYYTLWSVREVETLNPYDGHLYLITHFNYRQNLSMNFEEAKKKIAEMAGEAGYDIDLDLKGDHAYFFTKRRISQLELYQFTFGKLTGQDMRISEEAWQLSRAMNQEPNPRRRVYARKRLIEMGELIRYDWKERGVTYRPMTEEEMIKNAEAMGEGMEEYLKYNAGAEVQEWIETPKKYCPKRLYEYMQTNKMKNHYFEDGKRVELELKRLGKVKFFNTAYGESVLVNFQDKENRIFKYMGATYPDIDDTDFKKVKATIKHEEYRGQKETKLQRIKIL